MVECCSWYCSMPTCYEWECVKKTGSNPALKNLYDWTQTIHIPCAVSWEGSLGGKTHGSKEKSKDHNTTGMLKKKNSNLRPKGLLSMNFAAERGLFFLRYLYGQRCLEWLLLMFLLFTLQVNGRLCLNKCLDIIRDLAGFGFKFLD